MKKNAFTLIELIVVIAILLMLTLLVTPKINKIIEENRTKSYKEIEQRLEEAAGKYIIENYVGSNNVTITKQQLIDGKYIGEIYDLKDNTVCDASVAVSNLQGIANFSVSLTCSNYHS